MKKLLKEFKHKGKIYEIIIEKREDGIFIIKDFCGENPFSPFYHCINDLGLIDINEIETKLDQPVLNHLISQSEDGARYWADNKRLIFRLLPN